MRAIACHGEGDARRAVSGGFDKTLLVWDLDKGGAPLLKLEGHTEFSVFAIACHGEGDDWCIVSGSQDGTVRLWDGAAGAVYPLGSAVESVALAPRAGEVDVFAAVGKSFARLALRAGPSQLEERIKGSSDQVDLPRCREDGHRRKALEEERRRCWPGPIALRWSSSAAHVRCRRPRCCCARLDAAASQLDQGRRGAAVRRARSGGGHRRLTGGGRPLRSAGALTRAARAPVRARSKLTNVVNIGAAAGRRRARARTIRVHQPARGRRASA